MHFDLTQNFLVCVIGNGNNFYSSPIVRIVGTVRVGGCLCDGFFDDVDESI